MKSELTNFPLGVARRKWLVRAAALTSAGMLRLAYGQNEAKDYPLVPNASLCPMQQGGAAGRHCAIHGTEVERALG